jgi:hypothetical protein
VSGNFGRMMDSFGLFLSLDFSFGRKGSVTNRPWGLERVLGQPNKAYTTRLCSVPYVRARNRRAGPARGKSDDAKVYLHRAARSTSFKLGPP